MKSLLLSIANYLSQVFQVIQSLVRGLNESSQRFFSNTLCSKTKHLRRLVRGFE